MIQDFSMSLGVAENVFMVWHSPTGLAASKRLRHSRSRPKEKNHASSANYPCGIMIPVSRRHLRWLPSCADCRQSGFCAEAYLSLSAERARTSGHEAESD